MFFKYSCFAATGHSLSLVQASMRTRRDNHAEGMVFRKRFYTKESFSGGERPSKSVLKTYLRNLEKNIFWSEIYDFVIKFS